MFKRSLLVCAGLAALFCVTDSGQAAMTEREPNDTPQQATVLGGDLAASGVFHKNDQDWYKFRVPAAGKVTATVSGLPADCRMQVTGIRGDGATGLGSGVGTVTFDAPAGDVYIKVSLNAAAGVCVGSDWCGVQCSAGGAWYVTPEKDGTPPRRVAATESGKPVLGPISYRLQIASAAAPPAGVSPPPPVPTTGVAEREPNDAAPQATPISAGGATGVYHRNDQDWYKLTLPAGSKVTATVSGLPADCQMQVTGIRGDGATGLGSGVGTVTFDAPAGDVYLRVSLSTVASGVCAGSDWCGVQCRPGGPWHVAPAKDGTPSRNVPATEGGQPILGPISYRLQIASSVIPTTPPTTPPGGLPPTGAKPQGELIKNSAMRGSGNWTVVEWYKPSAGKGEVFFDSDGVRFWSQGGNNRIGILQEVNQDVSGCTQLLLTATVKADEHRLTGTGHNGREAPIALFGKYTDASGAVHELLSENPAEPRNMFWHGFYYLDPVAPSIATHGTKVARGSWQNYAVDLMTRNPKPRHIHFVGAEGAGWAVRDGKIGGLSLQCR